MSRKIFYGSVSPLPAQSGVSPQGLMVHAATPNTKEHMPLQFSFELPPDKVAELEAKISRGDFLTPAELKTRFSPSENNIANLANWLKNQGYRISQITPNAIFADAPVDRIEDSLAVKIVKVTQDGITYPAAQNAPSLPSEVSEGVQSIGGLQPFLKLKKHFRMTRHARKSKSLAQHLSANPSIDNIPPYLASELLSAYNGTSSGVTGKGQVIAILIDTFPRDEDMLLFWQHNNINTDLSRIKKINVKDVSLPEPEGEETLDAQWTSAIAPDAEIRIYASGSLQFPDLDRALDLIIEDAANIPGLRQLSISLGLGETFMSGIQAEVSNQHQKFLKLAALGVNVFVSSGDAGSNPDVTGHNSSGALQAEHPASDPFVIGVGGTSLELSVTGITQSETAWTGSGGGQSIFYNRPIWQKGNHMPGDNARLVPDVALAADPNFGAYVIFQGTIRQIGGTSWSAPVWAGICALINESRIRSGKTILPFLNQLLYTETANSCLRDITEGTNGGYMSQSGYDMVTGLGVADIKKLLQLLG